MPESKPGTLRNLQFSKELLVSGVRLLNFRIGVIQQAIRSLKLRAGLLVEILLGLGGDRRSAAEQQKRQHREHRAARNHPFTSQWSRPDTFLRSFADDEVRAQQ